MCELLGMSANVPTDLCFSFTGLMQRGGETGPHKDGWGIGFYEGKGYRAFHDPQASANSEIARLLQGYSIKSKNVISHIRQANRGKVALENTHPFARELWGRIWSFAHNGQLKGIKQWTLPHYQPVGTSDSEHAFCWLLGTIREEFPKPPTQQRQMHHFISQRVGELAQLGVFNCLISDGRSLYTYCSNRLVWITRKAPFGPAKLIDADVTIDFTHHTRPDDVVTVISTQPLTSNEQWQNMAKGEFSVFRNGGRVWSKITSHPCS